MTQNKFVTNLDNNEQETSEVQFKEHALKLVLHADLCELRVFLWIIGDLGHSQLPQRTGHGCTVGVNRDPPVWPSTQAGWWRYQSASLTYIGRVRATFSRRRGKKTCAPAPLLDLFVSTIWSTLGVRPHFTTESLHPPLHS